MLRSNVTVEIALLRETELANGASELRIDTALVVPVSPERSQDGVDAIAVGTHELLPSLSPFVRRFLRTFHASQRLFVALVKPVTRQGRLKGERLVAVGTEILSRAPTSNFRLLIFLQAHRT